MGVGEGEFADEDDGGGGVEAGDNLDTGNPILSAVFFALPSAAT
ncbi:MAG: hypothetical protein NTV51_05430 [Verrucomicrobia bacterium]|nr:hypothetical protein [Verrucomicrobiota bacterium]